MFARTLDILINSICTLASGHPPPPCLHQMPSLKQCANVTDFATIYGCLKIFLLDPRVIMFISVKFYISTPGTLFKCKNVFLRNTELNFLTFAAVLRIRIRTDLHLKSPPGSGSRR